MAPNTPRGLIAHLTQSFKALSFPAVTVPGAAANAPVYVDIDSDAQSREEVMRNPDSVAAARSETASELCGLATLREVVRMQTPFEASNQSIAKQTINAS